MELYGCEPGEVITSQSENLIFAFVYRKDYKVGVYTKIATQVLA